VEAKQVKILMVEDNPGDVRLVRELFTAHANGEYELVHEMCLEKALKRLAGERFSFILLDLFLIDSFGLDTLKSVREAVPEAPIIVLTGFYDAGVASLAREMGAEFFFEKEGLDGSALMTAFRSYAKAG
jgi:DNA-binding NarL/FixJ family response regulator